MDIARFGLNYAYKKMFKAYGDYKGDKFTSTKNPKKVIIVGAGMAGLSAGYELSKVGHDVEILEMQTRLGGRVKTIGEKEGFAKYCYVDGMYVCIDAVYIRYSIIPEYHYYTTIAPPQCF